MHQAIGRRGEQEPQQDEGVGRCTLVVVYSKLSKLQRHARCTVLQQFQLISARGHFLDTGHPCERAHGGQRAGNHGPLVDTGKNEDRAQVAQAIRLVLHTLRRKNMNLTSKAPKNNLQLRADILQVIEYCKRFPNTLVRLLGNRCLLLGICRLL